MGLFGRLLRLFGVLTLLVLQPLPLTLSADHCGDLVVESTGFDRDGIATLRLRIEAKSEITIYSWRGNLYPFLGYGLCVRAVDVATGVELNVEAVGAFMPKVARKPDAVSAREYQYPEPLRLRLMAPDGRAFLGCADVSLVYDSTSLDPEPQSDLTKIKMTSNLLRICNKQH